MEVSVLDWDDLRYFLAIHRGGNLTQAARALEVNPTTVGRRLTTLEERLGTRLFDRTPEGFIATATGLQLLPAAERMEDEALGVERELSGNDQRLAGVVRLTATEMLATRFVAPQLGVLRARHPEIRVDLICTSQELDLSRREADVSLRISRPKEDGLVIKRLTAIPLAVYASRAYLDHVGRNAPGHTLHLLGFAEIHGFRRENDWLASVLPEVPVALRSTSVSSIYSACTAGLGLALLPSAVADRDSRLERVPTPSTPEPRWVWQAVHRDMQGVARVRAVVDFLAKVLSEP